MSLSELEKNVLRTIYYIQNKNKKPKHFKAIDIPTINKHMLALQENRYLWMGPTPAATHLTQKAEAVIKEK